MKKEKKQGVMAYVAPYKRRIGCGLVIKILGTLMNLGLPYIMAYMIDHVIARRNVMEIVGWGGLMLLLAFTDRTLNIIANRNASRVARDTVENMRNDLYDKVQHLSGRQLDELTIPSLISRLTSDTYNIHTFTGAIQRMGVRGPIILMGGIVVTLTMDAPLALIFVSMLPVMIAIVIGISKKGIPLYLKVQKRVDRMVRIMRENVTGVRVIKALSRSEHEKQRFGQAMDELVASELHAGSIMALSNPLMNLVLNLSIAMVVLVGAYRVNAGSTLPGTLIAFLSYITMMLHAIMAVNRMFVLYSRANASASRIREVFSLPNEFEDVEEVPKPIVGAPVLSFSNVNFDYPSSGNSHNGLQKEKDCLAKISFQISEGGSLGIIGATGSGKSTIAQLALRFYECSKSIQLDGRFIEEYPLAYLRGQFGIVFQNDTIFSDTIEENIRFGRDINKEQIEKAARCACAHEFIMEKEKGYDYKLAIRGSNLSGGQKQRLLIARALAGNPRLLILDDSSSALDYQTDLQIRTNLQREYSNTIRIVIAQRVSAVMNLQKILILEEGHCMGLGNHEELLASCEIYREIYESQKGGECS